MSLTTSAIGTERNVQLVVRSALSEEQMFAFSLIHR